MTATLPDLLDGVTALLGRRNLTQQEIQNWWTGAANGGPNGDGLYPFTYPDGTQIMQPSPAKALATLAGGGLDAAGVAALLDGDATDLGAGFRVLVQAQSGAPKRMSPTFFATPNADAMQRVTLALGDEVLPSFSAQRKTAVGNGYASLTVGQIAAGISGYLNPRITRGAKGDGQYSKKASTTNNSNIVELVDARFTPADVGKLIFLSNVTGSAFAQSTITEYIDSRHVRMALTANTTFSNQYCLWGTDDTAALQLWLGDLGGAGGDAFGRVGLLPEGIFLSKPLKYGARMAIDGASRTSSIIHLIPGGTGPALLYNSTNLVDYPVIRNITLMGSQYINYSGVGGLSFASVDGGSTALPDLDPHPYFSDIDILGFPGTGFTHSNRGAGSVRDFLIRDGNYYGMVSTGYDMTYSGITTAANRFTGIVFSQFGSANNRISGWYSYFNGTNPYAQGTGAAKDPVTGINWMDAANLALGGGDNEVGFGSAQESWGSNIVVFGTRCRLIEPRCDDTGCVRPAHGLGGASLMSVRAAVHFCGSTNNGVTTIAERNIVRGVYVDAAVHAGTNFATHDLFFSTNSDRNRIEIDEEIGIAAFYGSGTGAYAPGRTGTDSSGGYLTNTVRINNAAVIN